MCRKLLATACCALLFLLSCWPGLGSAQGISLSGRVGDVSGGVIAGAQLALHTTQGAVVTEATTGADGTFAIAGVPAGSYVLEVSADRFDVRRLAVTVGGVPTPPLEIHLGVAAFRSEVTVTAERGNVADIERTTALVTARAQEDFRTLPLPTIGSALRGAPGVLTQQSSHGQASPFLRGLTGYQVLTLIDGVRFNNSTFRSGPNQYLAFVDPTQAAQIEAMLGPASSQYGSDAMGGTIQLLTPAPQFSSRPGLELKGGGHLFGASADASVGGDLTALVLAPRLALAVGGSRRDLHDLRAGRGRDSRHVLARLFGLTGEQIRPISGGRQTDTGFSQTALQARLTARMAREQNVTLWYQGSQMDDVRGYKDLWGGLGRVRSDFDPQRLRFFYARYETLGVKGLDALSGTFSINSQSDGSIRQGLNLTDPITQDTVRVDALGYAVQATRRLASRHSLVFGGELYDEGIGASREITTPHTGVIGERRALYPNGSTYRTSGLFAQNAIVILPDRLTAVVGGRFTHVAAETFADENRTTSGESLGVVNTAERFQDWTYNAGVTWRPSERVSVHFLTGRGFRAPNMNDLGALGLNDLGYEVPARAALETGGLVGASDGEGVLSTGRLVSDLRAERLFNYELGAAVRWSRTYVRAHVFDAELKDPIVRRTLVFPLDRVPTTLEGVPVTAIAPSVAQAQQSVASVATSLDPRAVKAFVNEGRARYYGLDALFTHRLSTRWSAEGNYSYLVGHEQSPTRPVRRLPPQQGFLALRYQPGGRLRWVGLSAHLSGAQTELSGGDVTDERIGAARRRSDITDFFRGSLVSRYILPGPDARLGTDDDLFGPTGETVAQIRDRVLPLGATINGVTIVNDATRVPLYTETASFLSLDLGAGLAFTDNVGLDLALTNLLDRNYRVHGSGVDSAGTSLFSRLRLAF